MRSVLAAEPADWLSGRLSAWLQPVIRIVSASAAESIKIGVSASVEVSVEIEASADADVSAEIEVSAGAEPSIEIEVPKAAAEP